MATYRDCGCGNVPGNLNGFGQETEAGSAVAAMASSSGGQVPTKSIALGVATGVLVWFITRFLDGKFTRR